MPFIEVPGMGDDYEDEVVPEANYDLRITQATDGRNKADTSDQIQAIIAIENSDVENPGAIFHYLTFPNEDDDDNQRRGKMRNITRFLKVFDIPFEKNGVNSDDMAGSTGNCLVVLGEYEGTPKNELRLPKVE
jgi:hypothetical protein|tara:strand:- start:7895 stop:8293 length:399 start_codon:yes stop_codon:yes gene_type:complete